MEKQVKTEAGWKVSNPKYGEWFISRDSVIADWKQDREQAYPGEPVPEPDEDCIQTWFFEQISWIEIAHYGVRLKGPDMAEWERIFMEQMKRNSDGVWDSDPKETTRPLD